MWNVILTLCKIDFKLFISMQKYEKRIFLFFKNKGIKFKLKYKQVINITSTKIRSSVIFNSFGILCFLYFHWKSPLHCQSFASFWILSHFMTFLSFSLNFNKWLFTFQRFLPSSISHVIFRNFYVVKNCLVITFFICYKKLLIILIKYWKDYFYLGRYYFT